MAIYTDNFNRSNESPIGSPWAALTGLTGCNIVSNELKGSVASTLSGSYYDVALTDDQACEIKATYGGGNWFFTYAGVRFTAGATGVNGYAFGSESSAKINIVKYTNGSKTSLGSASYAISVGEVMKITAVGTTIKLYINDVEKLSVTDSTWSSGKAFVMIYSNESFSDGDDFKCEDLGIAPSTDNALFFGQNF